jgi:hypothetical protein
MYQFETNPELKRLFETLGKYKTGKGCLYVYKITDVDIDVLKELIKHSYNAS